MLLFVHDPEGASELEAQFVGGLRGSGVEVSYVAVDPRAAASEQAGLVARAVERARTLKPGSSFVVGGFSWWARVAARGCAGIAGVKLLCLGFPFHPHGLPADTSRLSLLEGLPETLIVQGERDAHGSRSWVGGKKLPTQVRVEWIADGNHRFVPRASGTATREDNLARVVEAARAFCA